jgi:hypothetical protein
VLVGAGGAQDQRHPRRGPAVRPAHRRRRRRRQHGDADRRPARADGDLVRRPRGDATRTACSPTSSRAARRHRRPRRRGHRRRRSVTEHCSTLGADVAASLRAVRRSTAAPCVSTTPGDSSSWPRASRASSAPATSSTCADPVRRGGTRLGRRPGASPGVAKQGRRCRRSAGTLGRSACRRRAPQWRGEPADRLHGAPGDPGARRRVHELRVARVRTRRGRCSGRRWC